MLSELLELLESGIRYGRETLPECCERAADRAPAKIGQAFQRVSARMQENAGEGFPKVFTEELMSALEGLPLKEEDRQEFLRFAGSGSYADGQMQLRVLEQSREQLVKRRETLERESGDRCRMAVSLGVMSGLFLLLVLL